MKLKTQEELDETLCKYCPLPDECKGAYNTPGSLSVGCEGSDCKEAYEFYMEKAYWEEFYMEKAYMEDIEKEEEK